MNVKGSVMTVTAFTWGIWIILEKCSRGIYGYYGQQLTKPKTCKIALE